MLLGLHQLLDDDKMKHTTRVRGNACRNRNMVVRPARFNMQQENWLKALLVSLRRQVKVPRGLRFLT